MGNIKYTAITLCTRKNRTILPIEASHNTSFLSCCAFATLQQESLRRISWKTPKNTSGVLSYGKLIFRERVHKTYTFNLTPNSNDARGIQLTPVQNEVNYIYSRSTTLNEASHDAPFIMHILKCVYGRALRRVRT